MRNRKRWLPLAATLAIGAFLASATPARGQGQCVAFTGKVSAAYNGAAWVGAGVFTFGKGQPRTATIVDKNTGMKLGHDPTSGKNVWIGTETATWTFDDSPNDSFQLITRFVTEHMIDPSGVFRVNESGTIANGTGMFQNAYGHFTVHGPFGPGVPGPGEPGQMNWSSEYHGEICGIK